MKNLFVMIFLFVAGSPLGSFAQSRSDMGQNLQIYTRLHSFVGKPTWLIIIRDLDHGQNIPYLYDIKRGNNYWMALTFSRNYLILASTLVFNPYEKLKINNFCNLESNGRIVRGDSFYITVTGDLSPNSNGYTCNVSRFTDPTN